jgi:hypothetical protein
MKMHFLCLHGYGSTAAIFAAHTESMPYEMGKEHTYDFVQGLLFAKIAPSLEAIPNHHSPHFAYYELESPSSFIDLLHELRECIHAEAPFDGITAFSHGRACRYAHCKCLA